MLTPYQWKWVGEWLCHCWLGWANVVVGYGVTTLGQKLDLT